MFKYFKNSSYTAVSLNKERKRLSFKYHPDMGGNESDFIAMNKEYEVLLKQLKKHKTTTEPTKPKNAYQKASQQPKKTKPEANGKQEPKTTSSPVQKKKNKPPVQQVKQDLFYIRLVLKKVWLFSIKHPLLCSNPIHTTAAIMFSIFGIILALGNAYIFAGILLVYSLVSFMFFWRYILTMVLVLLLWYFIYESNPEYFLTVILTTFTENSGNISSNFLTFTFMKKLLIISLLLCFSVSNLHAASNVPVSIIKAEVKELITNIKWWYEFMTAYETYSNYYSEWGQARQDLEYFFKLRKLKINATNTTTLNQTKAMVLWVKNNCTHNTYIETQLRSAIEELNLARTYLKKHSKTTKVWSTFSYDMAELMTIKTKPMYFLTQSCDKIAKQADALILQIDKKLQ